MGGSSSGSREESKEWCSMGDIRIGQTFQMTFQMVSTRIGPRTDSLPYVH